MTLFVLGGAQSDFARNYAREGLDAGDNDRPKHRRRTGADDGNPELGRQVTAAQQTCAHGIQRRICRITRRGVGYRRNWLPSRGWGDDRSVGLRWAYGRHD